MKKNNLIILVILILIILLLTCKTKDNFNPNNFIGKYITVGFDNKDESESTYVNKYENGIFYGSDRGIEIKLIKVSNNKIITTVRDAMSEIKWEFIYEGKKGRLKLIASSESWTKTFDIIVEKIK